jgi:hypothetical protein
MLSYVVDRADRIVEIDGPWDAFAAENGAPHLTRAVVLQQPLLSFVEGAEMKLLVNGLLTRSRAGETLVLPFRCDSPILRRFLLFESFRLADHAVQVVTTVEHVEPRSTPELLEETRPRGTEVLMQCSWCLRVRIEAGHWEEIEDAIAALGLFDGSPIPRITHGICPGCRFDLRGRFGMPPG